MLRPRSKPSGLISRIDVTAFLSIMVVLFFTVLFADPGPLWPHHYATRPVDLPRVKHPAPLRKADREDAIHVAVERDGSIFCGNDRVSPAQLPAKLAAALQRGSEKKVYIHADARAKYETVKQVLDATREAGIGNVAFLADVLRTGRTTY